METIEINGITINLQKKRIKYLHLYVKPPNGEVYVSSPLNFGDENIRNFIAEKSLWIKTQQERYIAKDYPKEHLYITGEYFYVWGKKVTLKVIFAEKDNSVTINDNVMILMIKKTATTEKRKNYIKEWYRSELVKALPPIFGKYESIMNVHANEWKTKEMSTRWGTCNVNAKRIWLNLELAKKDPSCLDYVVAHELCHLLERSHNAIFKSYMDKFCPSWKEIRVKLNS